MHHPSVNKSPPPFLLTALGRLFLTLSSRLLPSLPVVPDRASVVTDHATVIPHGTLVIPAYAGISHIQPSHMSNHVETNPHSTPPHIHFSTLHLKIPSLRLLLTLLILPFIFALDLFYFTLARPGCPACGSLGSFLTDSSLSITLLQTLTIQRLLPVLSKND